MPMSTNPSLCHGAAGRVVALRLAEENATSVDTDAIKSSLQRSLQVLRAQCLQQNRLETPLEMLNDSLMVGRAGVLWAFACAIDDRNDLQPTLLRLRG